MTDTSPAICNVPTPPAHELGHNPARDNLDTAQALEFIIHRWHDDHHDGAFVVCLAEPCRAINAELGQRPAHALLDTSAGALCSFCGGDL